MENLCNNLLAVSHGNLRLLAYVTTEFWRLVPERVIAVDRSRPASRLCDSDPSALFAEEGLIGTLYEDYPWVQ